MKRNFNKCTIINILYGGGRGGGGQNLDPYLERKKDAVGGSFKRKPLEDILTLRILLDIDGILRGGGW